MRDPDDRLTKDLFQPVALSEEEQRAREEKMGKVLAAEDPSWIGRAQRALKQMAASGIEFTSEDLRERAGNPDRPNSIGAIFNLAHRERMIRPAGVTMSPRPGRRGAMIRIWIGDNKE